ncbi:MAG: helix-turn-helix domain-containing protein [Sphingobium sp.]|nr:helix-turn-helix domain-containing protein [Sphingobium sp.]
MNKEDFESLKRAMGEVKAYQEGARDGYVTHEPVDVKALRKRTGLTQKAFADRFHLPARTLQEWEQQRRLPDAPARALLALIQKDADTIAKMLADHG